MNFDFGEVLRRAWQITWKQKVLWIIVLSFGVLVSLMFPLIFAPAAIPILIQSLGSDPDLMVILMGGFLLIFFLVLFLFMLVMYPASVLTQTSLTLGVLDVEQKREPLSAADLLRRSKPFFWRVLGLMLLFAFVMTVVNLIIQGIFVLLAFATFGVGAMCATPFMILYYPALYAAIVWMEQAMNGIIVNDLPVLEAVRRGWDLIRRNLLTVALMALIVYFGIGMLTGVIMVPLMLPLFALPLSFMGPEVNWLIIAISGLSLLVFIPLFAILTGCSMIFSKSAWVLTYLRLTRSPTGQALPQEAAS